MNESTAFDEIVEESERRGEIRGEARGEARGEIKRSHRVLLRQGMAKFGSLDSHIEAELTNITDLERLERMAEVILTAKSWAELLATA